MPKPNRVIQPKPQRRMLTIQPAYARKYETAEALLADWNGGKDFKTLAGPYLSIRDTDYLKRARYTHLHILNSATWSPKSFETVVEL